SATEDWLEGIDWALSEDELIFVYPSVPVVPIAFDLIPPKFPESFEIFEKTVNLFTSTSRGEFFAFLSDVLNVLLLLGFFFKKAMNCLSLKIGNLNLAISPISTCFV